MQFDALRENLGPIWRSLAQSHVDLSVHDRVFFALALRRTDLRCNSFSQRTSPAFPLRLREDADSIALRRGGPR